MPQCHLVLYHPETEIDPKISLKIITIIMIKQMSYLILVRWPDLLIINKKMRTCQIMDLTIPANLRGKMKESKKRDKYLDLARELKKLWNMKVTVMPSVISMFVTVIKGLVSRLKDLETRGCVETIQTTALLRLTRILRRVLGTWVELLSLRLQWKNIS